MQLIEIITNSSKETKKVGFELAAALGKEPAGKKQAMVIALEGDLGSGKTAFIQGLAQGLGVEESVLSPTFVILKEFSLSFADWKHFYHIDAYRLKNPDELLELGFKDLIKNPENIIAIEWADRIKKILPKNILRIGFKNLEEDKRMLAISNI